MRGRVGRGAVYPQAGRNMYVSEKSERAWKERRPEMWLIWQTCTRSQNSCQIFISVYSDCLPIFWIRKNLPSFTSLPLSQRPAPLGRWCCAQVTKSPNDHQGADIRCKSKSFYYQAQTGAPTHTDAAAIGRSPELWDTLLI